MASCRTEEHDSSPKLVHRQASGPHQQGYDYEFVPHLDSKYECSICLLCQREPTQTTCGHRFCRDCILTWIRTESQRCPEDNSPITEQDVFPDNFAKREILCLSVRCPNNRSGCPVVTELGQMDEHQRVCSYQSIPCPNGCPEMLLQQDVSEHIAKECLHRVIECSLCYAKFPLNQQQAHFKKCPMVSLAYYQANQPNQEMSHQFPADCGNMVIRCPFADIGCEDKVQRERLQDHLSSNMQHHLRLLLMSHYRLHHIVSNLSSMLDSISHRELTIRQNSAKPQVASAEPDVRLDQLSLGEGPSTELPFRPHPLPVNDIPEQSLLTSAEGLMKELFQRNIQSEQRYREQEIKMVVLRQRLADCETQMALLREQVTTAEARFCNGHYVWPVEGISRIAQEARHLGHSRLVHSPGFHTSAFGYKACLRLNVHHKDQTTFLSLFIHLMQGEHDDVLDWPFLGIITFTVLDHPILGEPPRHISETMTTKPGLAAFQRPNVDRNPKGFGFTEFIDFDVLTKGSYIHDDTITIKAVVKEDEHA